MSKFLTTSLSPQFIFISFAVFTLLTIFGAVATGISYLYAMPFVALLALFVLLYFKNTYLLLFFCLPLSIEFELNSSLATDLPTEPLMAGLMFACILYYLMHPKQLDKRFLNHPIIVFVCVHIVWIAIATFYSSLFLVSFKFLLAKLWYVIPFVGLTALFVKKQQDFKPFFWAILIPFVFTIIYTLIRHAGTGYGFHEANVVVKPFFRNHVNYAVMVTAFFPFLLSARKWYKSGSLERLFINGSILLFFVGILLAYTRSAYVSLIAVPLVYLMFKWRLTKWTILMVFIVFIGLANYYITDNRFLAFAPDFETTIYHDDLDAHLTATFEGKDMSFMERVHRWVAAARMSQEHVLTGFGPGNFYNFYQPYTLVEFETYMSDNPERSGVHNYFLMLLTDQGFIGLLLFLLLCICIFVKGEQIYHQTKNVQKKSFVITILVSLSIILINLLVSDLIEGDKIGSLFFVNIALLVNMSLPENTNH